MNNDDVNYALTRNKFDELTHCIDPTFELVHGFVHTFVGGFMFDVGISPNDPAFFAHHCFIDYIFEEFRQTKQNPSERETDYPAVDVGKGCAAVHFGNATMKPFSIKNLDGLKNIYTKELFYYQPRPTCSQISQSCSSPYLYCDTKKFQCISKIRPGGNCTGYTGTEICYRGQCNENGRCSELESTTTSGRVTMADPTTITPSSISTTEATAAVPTSTAGTTIATTALGVSEVDHLR
uniref:Tyrosinase copper-binding domain-containing protein n=1 Tax=Romanomermis culicivorax TaxID=13658 RepID=A0A915JE97_ROMCU